MKTQTAALLTLTALAPLAHADPEIYIRDPNKPSALHRGLANGIPCILDIYGKDKILAAKEYGRSLVGHHSFAECKQMIVAKAEQLYRNQGPLVTFFERDAASGYDEQTRVSR